MNEHQTAAMPAENPVSLTPGEPRIAFASRTAAGIWFELYDRLEDVEVLWRAFEANANCTVFQRFDYLLAWQKHIGTRHGSRPLIWVLRGAGEEILGIAPFALDRNHGCIRLCWLGQDNSDYCGPLLDKGFEHRISSASFVRLWTEFSEATGNEPSFAFDYTDLRKMPERIGEQRNPFLALSVLPNPSNAHLMRMWGEWETFYSDKRSSSTRRRDRTKRKRLGEIGEVRMVTPDSEPEIEAAFRTLIEQKSAALARMGACNLFGKPGVRDFYLDLATNPRSRPFVHVSKLMVGNCQASTNLGFEHHGRYYYVLASYDNGDVSRFGPGVAHLRDLMHRAIDRGMKEFDFTIGDESYKSEWADVEIKLFDHVSASSWRGFPWATEERLKIRLRRAIKQNAWLWAFALKFRAKIGSFRKSPADPAAE